MARIHAEMETVKAQVGFTGTLQQFFEHIRTDPKFKPKSREALQQGYVAIGKRLDATLPTMFSTIPKTPLEIRPVPALTEKGAARGSYQGGTADGSRPGVFYFNAYDLPSRTTPGMETLYLHEGAPGHHFQISLAQENEALPSFMRFGGNTAYVEGWGLYAETLGRELGVYTDPYQYFGYLDSQLFRAIRLVVDTGIHSKGWTRDRTIQYILDNSSRGRSNATAETERYIAIPGQALAYKIGQIKISELRARAEKALGPRFDIREFHAQVLMTGRAAAGRAREEDRRLDRGEEGVGADRLLTSFPAEAGSSADSATGLAACAGMTTILGPTGAASRTAPSRSRPCPDRKRDGRRSPRRREAGSRSSRRRRPGRPAR